MIDPEAAHALTICLFAAVSVAAIATACLYETKRRGRRHG
jgi:hypothetical protein